MKNNVVTYYMPISSSAFSQRENYLMQYISDDRKSSINRFRFDESKILSLYSALLARFAICNLSGLSNDSLKFSKSEFGKPYLSNSDKLDFNISHTKGMILCSASLTGKIGVDAEYIRPVKYDIMKRCFHTNEIEYVEKYSASESYNKHFFEIWTKKEAYTKCIGTGLATDITSIDVLSTELSNNISFFENDNYVFSVYSESADEIQPTKTDIFSLEDYFSELHP